ncbi:MAG: hypothetical protein H6Q59_967 [Firmicutes bacterium]|nr:hypothetical protein [Bacillota bacterium]
MYNTENQIDGEQKVTQANHIKEGTSAIQMNATYQKGISCLYKNEVTEALAYFWEAVGFGYSRAIIPTILLEVGSEIPCEQSSSLKEVMRLIEMGHASGDEAATLVLAHWNMNWSTKGNGIKYIDLDTFELRSREREIFPLNVEDAPELQVMSLNRLDRIIACFSLRISTMGYLSDQVNTEYAVSLLKQLLETGGRKASTAEKYLYYLLKDNYELWIDNLNPWLQSESLRGNEYAARLLSRIQYRTQYSNKIMRLLPWNRG